MNYFDGMRANLLYDRIISNKVTDPDEIVKGLLSINDVSKRMDILLDRRVLTLLERKSNDIYFDSSDSMSFSEINCDNIIAVFNSVKDEKLRFDALESMRRFDLRIYYNVVNSLDDDEKLLLLSKDKSETWNHRDRLCRIKVIRSIAENEKNTIKQIEALRDTLDFNNDSTLSSGYILQSGFQSEVIDTIRDVVIKPLEDIKNNSKNSDYNQELSKLCYEFFKPLEVRGKNGYSYDNDQFLDLKKDFYSTYIINILNGYIDKSNLYDENLYKYMGILGIFDELDDRTKISIYKDALEKGFNIINYLGVDSLISMDGEEIENIKLKILTTYDFNKFNMSSAFKIIESLGSEDTYVSLIKSDKFRSQFDSDVVFSLMEAITDKDSIADILVDKNNYLEFFNTDENIARALGILSQVNDDNVKVEFFKTNYGNMNLANSISLLASIKDDKTKYDLLFKSLDDDKSYYDLYLKDDIEKLKSFKSYDIRPREFYKSTKDLINSIQDDDIKYKIFRKVYVDKINALDSTDYSISASSSVFDDFIKFYATFESDSTKACVFNDFYQYLSDSKYHGSNLELEKDLSHLLNSIKDDSTIISILFSDNYKKLFLRQNRFNDDLYRNGFDKGEDITPLCRVICSLTDSDGVKSFAIDTLKNMDMDSTKLFNYKSYMKMIKDLDDDDLRIEKLTDPVIFDRIKGFCESDKRDFSGTYHFNEYIYLMTSLISDDKKKIEFMLDDKVFDAYKENFAYHLYSLVSMFDDDYFKLYVMSIPEIADRFYSDKYHSSYQKRIIESIHNDNIYNYLANNKDFDCENDRLDTYIKKVSSELGLEFPKEYSLSTDRNNTTKESDTSLDADASKKGTKKVTLDSIYSLEKRLSTLKKYGDLTEDQERLLERSKRIIELKEEKLDEYRSDASNRRKRLEEKKREVAEFNQRQQEKFASPEYVSNFITRYNDAVREDVNDLEGLFDDLGIDSFSEDQIKQYRRLEEYVRMKKQADSERHFPDSHMSADIRAWYSDCYSSIPEKVGGSKKSK